MARLLQWQLIVNIPVDFATEIQNNYFKRFNGIAAKPKGTKEGYVG